MSEKKVEEKFEDEVLSLRDDIGHQTNIRMLIRLCYLAVGDEYLFAKRVNLLRLQLPQSVKDNDEFQEKLDDCTLTEESWEYKSFSGTAMGSPEDPVLVNDPKSWEYDPSKPTYPLSPIKVKKTWTDWEAVFELCIDELEKLKITWSKDEGGMGI